MLLKIRELRVQKDMTVEDIAKRCGVSIMTVYGWETGRYLPSTNLLPRLAAALRCKTIDELFEKAPTPPS